jgi:hypothetical protein
MSKKSWDRVPIDAQSIDAPLSRAAVFLVVTVTSESYLRSFNCTSATPNAATAKPAI